MDTPTQNAILKRHFWIPVTILAVSFLAVGCYTILKHPVTAEEGPQGQIDSPHPQEYYRQNCIDCHADYAEFPYGYFYEDYPEYYFEYPRWGQYYAYPWWWDHHWYDTPSDDESGAVVDGEKASRRGGMVPPYVTGAPAINTGGPVGGGGYIAPGSTSGGKPSTGGSTGAGGQQGEKVRVRASDVSDTTGSNDNKTEDTKSEKAPRRGGRKP